MASKKKAIKKKVVKKRTNQPIKKAGKKKPRGREKKESDFNGELPGQNIYGTLVRRATRFAKVGQPPVYTPDELFDEFVEYVDYMCMQPLYEQKVFGNGLMTPVAKMRAMSVQGFAIFAGMHRDTFYEYTKKKEYADICRIIKDTMRAQKFEGAAANLLNANLVARDLGLVDKTSIVDNEGNAIKGFNYIVPEQPK